MKAFRYSCVVGVLLFASTGCVKKSAPFRLSDVREAPAHLKEQRLEFRGTLHSNLAGRYEWKQSGGPANKTGGGAKRSQWKYVIPVTAPDWDRADPVTLWITFSSFRKEVGAEIRALEEAIARGTVIGVHRDFPARKKGVLRGASAWQNAVADAESRHGIKSDPRAPIVSWEP